MMATRRVSAKQRLELVKEAIDRFVYETENNLDAQVEDYKTLINDIKEVFTAKLEPKNKSPDELAVPDDDIPF